MNWYLKAFQEYATFSGRARRAEYWYFVLFYLIGIFVTSFLDGMLGSFSMEAGIGLLSGIFILVHILPSIAVSVRRLHDIGRTGWWYLIIVIPLIGPLVLFIFSLLDSKEDNQYGPNPKLATAVA
jgi:uncharacterized membrane protein YhaH (DUF805 family)